MNIRPLVLDENTRTLVEQVMTFACETAIPLEEVKRRSRGMIQSDGKKLTTVDTREMPRYNDDRNSCVLKIGYKLFFTVEEQPEPLGWVRHVSISVLPHKKDSLPNPAAVSVICALFGFREPWMRLLHYVENDIAVNVIEPLRDDDDPRALHLTQPWKKDPLAAS